MRKPNSQDEPFIKPKKTLKRIKLKTKLITLLLINMNRY